MTKEDAVENIAHDIQGTCDGLEKYIEYYKDEYDIYFDSDELEDKLLDHNIEICFCGWWVESHEMVDENDDVVGCDDCRNK